jgi:O-antigen/teichoic acid export membrane protein
VSSAEPTINPDGAAAGAGPQTVSARHSGLRQLVRNVFSNWVGLVLNMAVTFFTSPFMVRNLGDNAYGLWVLIRSTTGYMSLLDTGLRVSIVKYVAKHDAVGETASLNRTVSTALAIYSVIAVIVLVITAVLSTLVTSMFRLTPDMIATARVVVWIAGVSVAMSFVGAVFGGFLGGLQRYDVGNIMGVAMLLVRTAATVAVILAGFGIIALGWVHLGSQVVSTIIMVIVCFKLRPSLSLQAQYVNRDSMKTLYGYSVFVLMNNIAIMLLFRSGEIVAGMFLGAAAVTHFSIASTLTDYVQRIIVTMTMVLHPYSSAKHAQGQTGSLTSSVIVGTKLSLLIGLPATAGLIVLGDPFIASWMGESYATAAAPVLVVLALGRLCWFAQSGTGEILLGVGRHREVAILNLVTGILSFAGAMSLVRSYGLIGLAIGTAIPLLIVQGLIVPVYTGRALKVPVRDYLKNALLRPIAGTAPFVVVLVALTRVVHPQSVAAVAAIVLMSAPVFIAGAYFLSFSPEERRRYRDVILPMLFRKKAPALP